MQNTNTISTTGKNVVIEEFTDFNDLLYTNNSRPTYNEWASSRRKTDSWAGGAFDHSVDLLLHGWDEKVPEIVKRFEEVAANVHKRTYETEMSVVGGAVDVPLAIRGVPTCMYNQVRKLSKSKVIDIVYAADVSAGVSTNEIIEKGIELLVWINNLERSGYRCSLSIATPFARTDSQNWYIVTVKVKESSQPLNISRIAFPLAHPGMLRHIFFDWYERLPDAKYVSGYGIPVTKWNNRQEQEAVKNLFTTNNQVYIDYYSDFDRVFAEYKEVK